MRTVLITGAAGFLGRHFAKFHTWRDDKVIAVDDMSSPYAQWPKELGPLIVEDAAEFLASRVGQPEYCVVYHFAAPVGGREKIEGDPLFNADSLRLDSALFRWAVKAKPKTIVYPSSSAVYGYRRQGNGAKPLTEGMFYPHHWMWDAPDEMYGFTKLAGEFLAWKASNYGVNTLCIRPFSGYGEDQSLEYPVPSICKRAAERQDPLDVWGSGDQKRDFIYIDDVVAATWARVRIGVSGGTAMNIGTGVATSFNEIARMAAQIVGYEPTIRNLTDKPAGVMERFCDPKLMYQVYTPRVSLEDGLKRVIEAYSPVREA